MKNTVINHINKTIIKGFLTLLPILLTLYVLYWGLTFLDKGLKIIIPEAWFFPGIGLIFALLIMYGVGILTKNWLTGSLFSLGEKLLDKIPLVRTIYNSVRDISQFFDSDKAKKLNKPVVVSLDSGSKWVIGFLTQSNIEKLPQETLNELGSELVAVYFPMSYQIGGYTLLVPKSSITEIDMPVEQALQFVLTAGLSTNSS